MKRFLYILKITSWVLLVAAAGVLVGFVEAEHYKRTCSKVSVDIDYGSADALFTKKDIDSLIVKTAGNLKGKPLGYINTHRLESVIGKQPYVARVAVFETSKGELVVNIRQREPLLRVINNQFESFYLDQTGILLPVKLGFSARVPVANGHIRDSFIKKPSYRVNIMALSDSIYYDSLLTNLYRLSVFISHDPFLKAQIDQIYVTETQEFELVPKVGNHIILLGTAENLDEKFAKLLAFYKYGLNKIGWNKYNVINIKYRNQVVCSKTE